MSGALPLTGLVTVLVPSALHEEEVHYRWDSQREDFVIFRPDGTELLRIAGCCYAPPDLVQRMMKPRGDSE